jgi:hypothetical protein
MHPYVSEVLDRFPPSRTSEAKQIDITLLATPLSSAPFCTVSLDNDSRSILHLPRHATARPLVIFFHDHHGNRIGASRRVEFLREVICRVSETARFVDML